MIIKITPVGYLEARIFLKSIHLWTKTAQELDEYSIVGLANYFKDKIKKGTWPKPEVGPDGSPFEGS